MEGNWDEGCEFVYFVFSLYIMQRSRVLLIYLVYIVCLYFWLICLFNFFILKGHYLTKGVFIL